MRESGKSEGENVEILREKKNQIREKSEKECIQVEKKLSPRNMKSRER